MKKILTVAVLFIAAASLQAQPLPYYQDAYNESGEDLREALYDIIKVHTRLSYSSSSTDTWDVLKVSDKDTTNTSNVCLIYAGVSVDGPQEYNNGQGWNREHVWPQSLGGFNTSHSTARGLFQCLKVYSMKCLSLGVLFAGSARS